MDKQHRQKGEEKAFLRKFMHAEARFPQSMTDGCLDLLSGLLTMNPEFRVSAETAKDHPFFGETPEPTWHHDYWTIEAFERERQEEELRKKGELELTPRRAFEKAQREERERQRIRHAKRQAQQDAHRKEELERRKAHNIGMFLHLNDTFHKTCTFFTEFKIRSCYNIFL